MRATKVLFFFIFLSISGMLHAQTNFLKGYYITNANDTIRGYIENRSENRNSELIVFKEDLESKSTKIYPESATGYAVENTVFYETHTLDTKKGEVLHGFFKVSVSGKLSLLQYHSRYFAKNQEGKLYEITRKKEVSGGKMKEDFRGLGLLKVLMSDCEDMAGKVLDKEYKATDNFVNIFKRYNRCVGSSIYEPKKIIIKPHVDFGLQLSPTLSLIRFSTPSLGKAEFENKLLFSAGGFASIFIPKVNENLRLLLELTYTQGKHYSYFSYGDTNNDLFIELAYLKVPLLVRYSTDHVFFDIGIQNQFILKQDITWRVEEVQQNTVYTYNEDVIPLNSWSLGYVVGLGLKYELMNHYVRSSVRFCQSKMGEHPNKPVFSSIELNLSLQLTK